MLLLVRGDLLGRHRLALLLLVELLFARLLLLVRGDLLGRRRLALLLLVELLLARLLLLVGSNLLGRCRLALLLLVPLLARLLLGLGGCRLLGCRRRFALLLLFALLFARLFGFPLLAATLLGAFLGRLAFGTGGLGQDERCAVQVAGSDTPLQRVRAQRRGCHKQADCRARQNPWLAFHINFLLVGSHPCPNFHQPQLVPLQGIGRQPRMFGRPFEGNFVFF
ncbi:MULTISPECIES: hypothetical protein [unclassified Mesorhizobium]|uniref:hypothetical protein n=1 Tax=unclassified Mesorhizobium TaxID=325217 RepID=UPI001FDF560D|nr:MULTISPECIES: hypothetical protein [unclassified Mesorhizobium]